MKNAKISVIIPTYNRAWCVKNAIKSVITQNYYNIELFIIDDWSNDDTNKIVKEYLSDKIKYFYKENSWRLKSVNYAIDNLISKDSDLFFILDSDDEFEIWILDDINKEFQKNCNYVSYHYKSRFPKHITNRKSELIENYKKYVEVDYIKLITWKSHKWDFHCFINLHKLWSIRFEDKCSNGMENIFLLRLNKIWKSKYINKYWIFADSSRYEWDVKDNLTSYSNIYKRATQMIIWYNIMIQENHKEIIEIDKTVLWKWYFEQFQWCIIDRQLKKWFFSWENALGYSNRKNKIKFFLFWFLFLVPKYILPIILKIYYKTK